MVHDENREGAPEDERYFGTYRILQEYARGGMGIIYRAYHPGLEKEIALKTLLEGEAATRDQIERFHREAKAAARLRHPNIVSVHDVGISEGVHFFTMDFIDGRDMDELLDEGLLSMTRAVEILAKVGHALHYAHGQDIIHRDIKPANILIDETNEPYISDFGLAKDVSSHKKLSLEGMAIGTPEYMSPEQAEGKKRIDARCDVYSVGAVLYRVITGRAPFTGKTALDVLQRIIEGDPVPPGHFRPGVPKDLETVCLKCLEKRPERRYESAEDLALDLERFLAGEPVHAKPPSLLEKVARRAKKHRVPLLAGLAVLVAVAVTAFIASTRAKEESEHMTAQLETLRNRVASLAKQDKENRRSVAEDLRHVLEHGTAEQKEQARALLKALGKGQDKGAGPSLERVAARLLNDAESRLARHPDDMSAGLARFRLIAGFAADTPAGRKALQRAREMKEALSQRRQEWFAATLTVSGDFLARGKPGAAVRAWEKVLPLLADTRLATEASSRIRGILLDANRRYFEALARAETSAREGDLDGAVDVLLPFLNSDLDAIARLARSSIEEFEARKKATVAKEKPPLVPKVPVVPEVKTGARTPAFLKKVSSLVQAYDFAGLSSYRQELAQRGKGPSIGGAGVEPCLEDIRAVERLWRAFLQALGQARGRDVELLLKEKASGPPTARKVKVLGRKGTGLHVRMLNATLTIPLAKVHPLTVAGLASEQLGKGEATAYAAGLFLYFSGIMSEAETRLASAKSGFPGARWYLEEIRNASARALEREAREAFQAILALEREEKWKDLDAAVRRFRKKFEEQPFFGTYGEHLSRLERTCAPLLVKAQEAFLGKCRPAKDGGIRLTYGFARPEDIEDWVWAPAFDAYSMGLVERTGKDIRIQGATLRHLGLFDRKDFSAVLELAVPETADLWGLKVFNLFVKIRDQGTPLVRICRGAFKARPLHRTSFPKRTGDRITVGIACQSSHMVIHLGKTMVYAGDLEEGAEEDGFAVFSGPGTSVSVRTVSFKGRPLPANLASIGRARQAREKAEKLFRSARPIVLVTPSRVAGWKAKDLKPWTVGKGGGLRAEAVEDELDLESEGEFEDVLLEAVLCAGGKGEASIDLRNKSGAEREMILPTGKPGRWFKFSFAVYGGHGWGRIDGIPAHVEPPYAPILPGTIELDVEPGSTMHVRSLQVRPLKKTFRWPSGWVRLFNGKDLAGWVVQGSRWSWEIRDGSLRARRGEGERTALQSLESMKNFHLKLEVKGEAGSASRILFRQKARWLFVAAIPQDGTWHRVSISARGRKVRATVDDAPVQVGNTHEEGEVFESGSVSLLVRRGVAWFRNISLKAVR